MTGRDSLVAPFRILNAAFFAVVAVMTLHEAEHVAQVLQKDALGSACPRDCRGLLGFAFDVEWIHFAYNTSIFVALAALYAAYRMWRPEWRRVSPLSWGALTVGIGIQAYHVVEHAAKLDQWFMNGHRSPTPGLLGTLLPPPDDRNFSLIELHFVFNTVVFAAVLGGYLGFGFHRHIWPTPVLGRVVPVGGLVLALAAMSGIAWAAQPPTVRLPAGIHEGPLVLDRAQKLVGEPGAVVRGGIVVTADDVTVRDVAVVGGEYGLSVDGAKRVLLDRVSVSGAELDGVNVRRSSVIVRDCRIRRLRSSYAQGIDISFSFDLEPSIVEGCRITGGQEGIVTHSARVHVRENEVSATTLRGITLTEMSMATAEDNDVRDVRGVGIFCGDYSHCEIRRNNVVDTAIDRTSDDATRRGFGIQAHFGAKATLAGNRVAASPGGVAAFFGASIERD